MGADSRVPEMGEWLPMASLQDVTDACDSRRAECVPRAQHPLCESQNIREVLHSQELQFGRRLRRHSFGMSTNSLPSA